MKKLIIGISAADGVRIGWRLLELLREMSEVETYLVVSRMAEQNFRLECGIEAERVKALANHCYEPENLAAKIASGSFYTDGMIIAPCSMKTLAAIAHGYSDNLLVRAADVCLKERRKLVLLPREAPLNLAHLRNMTAVTEMGGIIFPPLPAFYLRPSSIDAMVDASLARVLDQLGIAHDLGVEWAGIRST